MLQVSFAFDSDLDYLGFFRKPNIQTMLQQSKSSDGFSPHPLGLLNHDGNHSKLKTAAASSEADMPKASQSLVGWFCFLATQHFS